MFFRMTEIGKASGVGVVLLYFQRLRQVVEICFGPLSTRNAIVATGHQHIASRLSLAERDLDGEKEGKNSCWELGEEKERAKVHSRHIAGQDSDRVSLAERDLDGEEEVSENLWELEARGEIVSVI